jgi:hypothetical protein
MRMTPELRKTLCLHLWFIMKDTSEKPDEKIEGEVWKGLCAAVSL